MSLDMSVLELDSTLLFFFPKRYSISLFSGVSIADGVFKMVVSASIYLDCEVRIAA